MNAQQISITHIPLSYLIPSRMNPRKYFDQAAIEELADSIRTQGVLQPILVRPTDDGERFEIIAGERRYRASKLAYGDDTSSAIPAIIRHLTEEEAIDIQIIENLQRKDLHPMEEANGFKNLATILNLPTEEIAARVGKSASYIAQRMKLCDLIDPLQQFFYDGHFLVKDAMAISKLCAQDQQDFYEEQVKDEHYDHDERLEINDWWLNKYRHALNSAPFDITSTELPPGVPACIECPHNSAVNTLLFPDMDPDPMCMNSSCFREKCELSFTLKLEEAIEDPETVLITGQWRPDEETLALMKTVSGVIEQEMYSEVEEPELPTLEECLEWCDDEETAKQEYAGHLEDYNKEFPEFEAGIKSGKYIRALNVGGHNKGTYCWVKLKRGAKAKAMASNASPEEIQNADTMAEIHRLKAREERAKELDDSKVWDQVKVFFNPLAASKIRWNDGFSNNEIAAIAFAMYNKLSWHLREDYLQAVGISKKSKFDDMYHAFLGLKPEQFNCLIRFFMFDTLPPGQIYGYIKNSDEAQAMYCVAWDYWPEEVQAIQEAQQKKAIKRFARVDDRIAKLKATLTPKKKAAKKAVVNS